MSIAPANGFNLSDKCRNCGHVNAFHVIGHNNEKIIPCEKVKNERRKIYCRCLNFDRRNNLEYLEDKYKEKHGSAVRTKISHPRS